MMGDGKEGGEGGWYLIVQAGAVATLVFHIYERAKPHTFIADMHVARVTW